MRAALIGAGFHVRTNLFPAMKEADFEIVADDDTKSRKMRNGRCVIMANRPRLYRLYGDAHTGTGGGGHHLSPTGGSD